MTPAPPRRSGEHISADVFVAVRLHSVCGARWSFGPQIAMRRLANVGMYVQGGESEPQCAKVQLRLSGLRRKITRRLEECVCCQVTGAISQLQRRRNATSSPKGICHFEG